MWQLDFKTAQFGPLELDPSMPWAGPPGLELATWLAQSLLVLGVRTNYPFSTDKGWMLDYVDGQGHAYRLRCTCLAAPAGGEVGLPAHWLVVVQAQLTAHEQMCGTTRHAAVQRLGALVRQALEAEHIALEPAPAY